MTGSTLIGLIGSAIQASRSPALHEQEASACWCRRESVLICRCVWAARRTGVTAVNSLCRGLLELAESERGRWPRLELVSPVRMAVRRPG